ncbi:hypothetical protein T03_12324 [Trichinella britovi]|uniref:Uncharacterized protein n=1 Tax=Trichinella britovi TaxID=45882 RepID=A0A0V1D665_TRIBR|nr:hypothetical protein T03_12324 [Trichinella britovi]
MIQFVPIRISSSVTDDRRRNYFGKIEEAAAAAALLLKVIKLNNTIIAPRKMMMFLRNNFKPHRTAGEILPSICRNYVDEGISQKSACFVSRMRALWKFLLINIVNGLKVSSCDDYSFIAANNEPFGHIFTMVCSSLLCFLEEPVNLHS